VKHDGYRIVTRKQGERVTLWSRHGTSFTDRLPRIAESVRGLAVEHALFDGEAVVFRPDGLSDFGALRTKEGGARACLVAFDLLNLDGEDLRQHPLEERRGALLRLVDGADGILFSEAIEAEGAVVFAKSCELGVEGIVSKRAGSRYGIVTPRRACGPTVGPIVRRMQKISYSGYRFPPEIIQQAIWVYLRFTLSLRDVEDWRNAESRCSALSEPFRTDDCGRPASKEAAILADLRAGRDHQARSGAAMAGSIRSLRRPRRRASVRSSSAPASRL